MTVFFKAESLLLTDYIRYLFPPTESGGLCKLKSSHLFGQLLISHVQTCLLPPERPEGDTVIEIELPKNDATQAYCGHFLWLSSAAMARLNMALKACFELDLNLYYARATTCGFQKKDIVEAFITSRGLVSTEPYDALHKRIYRREAAKREKLTQVLIRKLRYINEALDTSGLPTDLKI